MTKPGKPILEQFSPSSKDFPLVIAPIYGHINPKLYLLAVHPQFEFQFIKQGHGIYFIGGKSYPFEKRSLFVIPPNVPHQFILSDDNFVDKRMIIFPPALLSKTLLSFLFNPDFPTHMHLTENEAATFGLMLNYIRQELDQKTPYWKEIIRQELGKIVLMVRRISLRPALPPLDNPIISQLVSYIEANFMQPLRMPSLAKKFGFSERYLGKLFKKHVGQSLKHYILQRRIFEAQQLLKAQAGLKVSAVAEQVGFSEFAIFNRIFKTITNLTPTEYRRIQQSEKGEK